VCLRLCVFFFFKQKTAYEMVSDWSSDVCSSDLFGVAAGVFVAGIWVVLETIANPRALTHAPAGPLGSGAVWMAIRGVVAVSLVRSEERRVGKEGRARGATYE